jgi:hypothetical protein
MRFQPSLLVFALGPALVAAACGSSVDTVPKSNGGTGGGSTAATDVVSSVVSSTDVISSAVASTGAGGSSLPDVGVPSDVSPAPHMAAPKVVTLGGPILKAPNIYPVFFMGDDPTIDMQFADFVSKVGATDYWTQVVSEYGVGPATGQTPINLTEAAGAVLTDAQIALWLANKLNTTDAAFPIADENTLFALYYPKGTSISLPSQQGTEKSCQDFGGYHSSTTLDAAHGNMNVAYAVIPRCNNFDGFVGIDATTGAASHEFIEASTDPYPQAVPAYAETDINDIYWLFALGGGEVGDMCAQNQGAFQQFPELDYTVQRSWSNLSASKSHDPCVPLLPGEVYFNSAPAFKDTLALDAGGGQTISVKGIHIPAGQSGVLEVDLFSDAMTSGPWNVQAVDGNELMGGQPLLDFSFDQDHGENGQKLHLTINVLSANANKAEAFFLYSQLADQQNMWVGLVGN